MLARFHELAVLHSLPSSVLTDTNNACNASPHSTTTYRSWSYHFAHHPRLRVDYAMMMLITTSKQVGRHSPAAVRCLVRNVQASLHHDGLSGCNIQTNCNSTKTLKRSVIDHRVINPWIFPALYSLTHATQHRFLLQTTVYITIIDEHTQVTYRLARLHRKKKCAYINPVQWHDLWLVTIHPYIANMCI
jgi:hypothetical protein